MTISELFGEMMASRGVTSNSTTLEIIQALVDTTRQATDEVADMAAEILYDFLDGAFREYTECLTETPGEYVSNRTGEIVSVTMIP
jgi:hypothetical protein